MNRWLVNSTRVVLLLALVVLAGCASKVAANKASARTLDWNQRVGAYTFEQAVTDLGKPALVTETASGRTAEWVLKSSPRMSLGLGVGGGTFGGRSGVGVGVGSEIPLPAHGESLRLTFDTAGKLTEWTRFNYR